MNSLKRHEIFRRFQAANPHPTTELEYSTPFELLIAVILSAQATDVSVNKAMRKLFPVANTPAGIHALGVEGLIPYIQTIGLYRNKAKNVIETCRMLVELHAQFPQYGFAAHKGYSTPEHLEALRMHGPCIHHRRHFAPVAAQFALEQGVTVSVQVQ